MTEQFFTWGDLITYGGAALGAVLAVMQFRAGRTEMWESLAIILLAADYFLPMRRLGSFFGASS